MEIRIENLDKLVAEADKIFFSPEAEDTLVQLLEVQKQVDEAVQAAKARLEEAALKLNPNFSSIQSNRVRVYYRSYGSRYGIDEANLEYLPEQFYSRKVSYSVNGSEVDKFVKKKGALPVGIREFDRPKSIAFSLKQEVKDEV
jgi:hypothetical protein